MTPHPCEKVDIFVVILTFMRKSRHFCGYFLNHPLIILWWSLQILSCVQHGTSVRKALEKASVELNQMLAKTQGRITKLEASVDSGIAGATVRMVVAVDESDIRPKYIIWANEPGSNVRRALRRAQEKINARLGKLRGEIIGLYLKFITPPLPKRTYATLIVAVNEELPEKIGKLGPEERRERLAAIFRLLNNDPKAINLAQVAKVFGVSRDTIYKDMEDLGVKR
jgi:DNA-directed RNA polymerase subunit L